MSFVNERWLVGGNGGWDGFDAVTPSLASWLEDSLLELELQLAQYCAINWRYAFQPSVLGSFSPPLGGWGSYIKPQKSWLVEFLQQIYR